MTAPESLARVRAEFDSLLGGKNSAEDKVLKDAITMEACSDMTYLGYVV